MSVLLDSRTVTARKPWRCNVCDRQFEKGSTKHVQAHVDGGDFWEWRECPTCKALAQEFLHDLPIEGYGEGYTADHIEEWAREKFGEKGMPSAEFWARADEWAKAEVAG